MQVVSFSLDRVQAEAGLHDHRYQWQCSDNRLDASVWSMAPCEPLSAEPTEPLIGALARLQRVHAPPDALLVLAAAGDCFNEDQAPLLHGTRLMQLGTADDFALWDAAWRNGVAVYGVVDSVRVMVRKKQAVAADMIMALAYGDFLTGAISLVDEFEELPNGWSWRTTNPVQASILDAHGFEVYRTEADTIGLIQVPLPTGIYRLVLEASDGHVCYAQPRILRGVS